MMQHHHGSVGSSGARGPGFDSWLSLLEQLLLCRSKKGGVAQMVERSLSMREVQGSIPCISRFCDVGTQSLPSSVGRAQGP